jgi:hypothetical protein
MSAQRKPPKPLQPLDAEGLRSWRVKHNLNLEEMGKLTGVPWTTLRGLEYGRSVKTSPWWKPLFIIISMTDRIEELEIEKAAALRLLKKQI